MKRLIRCGTAALALGLIPVLSGANAQTAPASIIKPIVTGIPHSAFLGLSFDAGRGVAVGMGGAIMESGDAGQTWKLVPQKESTLALLAVARAGNHTIAVGQSGLVMIEEAPGQWHKVESGVTARLLGVGVNRAGMAVAVGQFGTVIKSADGGRSWENGAPDWKQQEDPNTFGTGEPTIYSAHVDEAGVVTIAGEYGVIMRSNDGAGEWRIVRRIDPRGATLFATHLAPAGAGNSYAVGQRGEMLVSGDGGETWVRKPLPVEGNFLGVAASKNGQVVFTGMRIMMRSLDGGQNWAEVRDGDATTDWYQAVRAVPSTGKILAVGHSGRIIRIGD